MERGTLLPNVTRVEIYDTPECDSDTWTLFAEGVYVWPNGWVTVYPDRNNQSEFNMYPPHRIARMGTG